MTNTYLSRPNEWPEDLSGEYIFLNTAIEQLGKCMFDFSWTTPPSTFAFKKLKLIFEETLSATLEDYVQRLLEWHDIETKIDFQKIYRSVASLRPGQSQFEQYPVFTDAQWKRARQIQACWLQQRRKRLVDIDTVLLAFGKAAASNIFRTVARDPATLRDEAIPGEAWRDKGVLRARHALGRIDIGRPAAQDPRGGRQIFVEACKFAKWLATVKEIKKAPDLQTARTFLEELIRMLSGISSANRLIGVTGGPMALRKLLSGSPCFLSDEDFDNLNKVILVRYKKSWGYRPLQAHRGDEILVEVAKSVLGINYTPPSKSK